MVMGVCCCQASLFSDTLKDGPMALPGLWTEYWIGDLLGEGWGQLAISVSPRTPSCLLTGGQEQDGGLKGL